MRVTKPELPRQKALSASSACALYDLDPRTMANLRSLRKGPRYFKASRKIYYRPEDIEAWLFGNPILTTDSLPEAHGE